MDFGEILEQWDKIQKESRGKKTVSQVSHKKANAPTKEEKLKKELTYEQQMKNDAEKKINPMELWLRKYGTVDKDKLALESEEYNKMESREYLRVMKPEARIDLHGYNRDEAWLKLDSFVENCLKKGIKKIEIVHGKGIHSNGSDPVLGKMVKSFIEQNKHLGASGHPNRNHGGSGVTWVILK